MTMTMTTAGLIAPRYSVDDFETTSIRSAAPSYVSEAPSYHSTDHAANDATPPSYTPRTRRAAPGATTSSGAARQTRDTARTTGASGVREQTIGLPPVPPRPVVGLPSMHNYRIPTWSTRNAPAARQLQSVVERRVNAGLADNPYPRRATEQLHQQQQQQEESSRTTIRPLEDPYLVGEEAAAQARRERLSRENGDDILIREDKQWDWMLAQMKGWDDREKSWTRFRREVDTSSRKKLLHRINGRRLF